MPETEPLHRPLKILKIITTSHNHHIAPTSTHSNMTNPTRLIHRNLRFRFLKPLSSESLSCFNAKVFVVASSLVSLSASDVSSRMRGLSVDVTNESKSSNRDFKDGEVDDENFDIAC
ncbi:hypothetical protein ACKS0A_07959 [Histoplasma ohiense]